MFIAEKHDSKIVNVEEIAAKNISKVKNLKGKHKINMLNMVIFCFIRAHDDINPTLAVV